jgi:hypothetical protein
MLVTPGRWQRCPYCLGTVLLPTVLADVPAQAPCAICGDPVTLLPGYADEDAVCLPCFDANLKGGLLMEQPAVAPLADMLPVRRRAIEARNAARWPRAHGQAQES